MVIASAAEFRALAAQKLPQFLFDYIDGAAYDETTCKRNVSDLAAVRLRQRVLRNVDGVSTRTHLLGEDWALPLALGPVGLSGMYARRGEVQANREAAANGIPMCLSTLSLCSLEEVAAAAARPLWFQLYIMRDRRFLKDLVARARAVG
ncbi:MAG: L-lactate dehydrogenase, partial [Gammaproteobacteria bacterium]|nr:L-lactate dehydrogenase [Gammaproteobacteria bacterium]